MTKSHAKTHVHVTGVEYTGSFDPSHCIPCLIGKRPQQPFAHHGHRSAMPGELLHLDACGPFPTLTPQKHSSAEVVTPADAERRTSSFNAGRTLLKSNPSLFISKTHLSVRQILTLVTLVTERILKRLASHVVKAFESEVKQDLKQPLIADELARVGV